MQYQVKYIWVFGLFLAFAGLTSLSCISQDKPMKTVSELQAVELAKKEILKEGLKVEDYQLTVETSTSGEDWVISIDLKVQRKPEGGYWVTVDKASGKTVFESGD